MDSKPYRQTKFIVAALAIIVAVALGAVAYAVNTGPDYLVTPSSSDQCDLPVAQRTGGWSCYTP